MKKTLLTLFLGLSSFFVFSQNPLVITDTIITANCDSSLVQLENLTPPQTPQLYYQWIINNTTHYYTDTSQAPLQVWLSNSSFNGAILNAYTDSNYQTGAYGKTHTILTDTCPSINLVDILLSQDSLINCGNSAYFTLNAQVVGGTAPYSFVWAVYNSTFPTTYTGQTQSLILNNGDNIILTVTDANNSSYTTNTSAQITGSANNLTATSTYTVDSSDCLNTTVTFQGASNDTTVSYEWFFDSPNAIDSAFTQNPTMTFSNASQFTVATLTVTDTNGCTATYSQTVTFQGSGMSGTHNVTNNSTNTCLIGQCNYDLTLTAIGGTAPFTYTLNGGPSQSSNLFTNLCAGTYQAFITDVNGCTAHLYFFIQDIGIQAYENYYFPSCDSNGTGGGNNFMQAYFPGATTVWSDGFVGDFYANPSPGSYNYIVTDSSTGCSVSGTIVVPNSNCYTITGNVYADLNGDCIFNGSDYAMSSVWVDLADATGTWLWIYDYTDANGNYSITAPAGTYYFDINGFNTNGFTQSCPATGFSVTIGAANPSAVVDFFMTPPPPVQDLSVSLHSFTTFTPGFPYWSYANYCNDGTIPMSGSVVMSYDANLTYIAGSSTSLSSHDTTNNTLTWNFTNLMPGQCYTVWPDFTTSTSAVLGTTMSNTIVINPITGDVTPANNTAYVIDTVVGSWDPNDKSVYPNGNITVNDKDHDYTIRFQNKGTAPATLVVVRDDLDDNLDIQTLRNVSASHNFVLTIENTDELVFTFNNIMLPAEQDDAEASNGSINFRISQKEDLPLGTVINNTAYIYFDFNEAVITNTTENTIVEKTTNIDQVELENRFRIYPNPTNALINIKSIDQTNITTLRVYNVLGKEVFVAEALNSSEAMLNLGNLTEGIYLIKLETEKGTVVEKITLYKK